MKSNVSDYLELLHDIYIDACNKCTADVSDLRDLETIRSRVKHEGVSFLTITLPQFARDFERSLATGVIDSKCFKGFKRLRHRAIPDFLQGMLSQVFNSETGEIYHDKQPHSKSGVIVGDVPTIVESVRQICLTFKKLELPCTPERVQASLNNYVTVERELQEFSVQEEDFSRFLDVSSILWDNMVSDFAANSVIPAHGPGQTSERISGNGKYRWRFWHRRLEPYFPLYECAYPLGTPHDSEEFKFVNVLSPEDELPVRVVQVPKTLKAPRIIAIEPCCMQYTQQAIRDYLYDRLEGYWLTRGHVNFRDQSVNQRLAIESSIDGRLATIDLSDASDRVPWFLAMTMFRGNQELLEAIDSCRSTRAVLPDGQLVAPLWKFASMGSALCFPVEAMYFYTICVVALLDAQNLSYTPRNAFKVIRDVYVYGDDIVVPSAYADVVLDYLQKYNCKVNPNKTFVSGSFRESCGVDAYQGYTVTPVYVHVPRPESKQQYAEIVSRVATANLFYSKGYWRTASLIFSQIESLIGFSLPYVAETSPAIGRISYLGYESIDRWNSELQRFEIRALVPKPVNRSDPLDGYGALTKCFLAMERRNDASDLGGLSLKHSALRGAVTLKLRWTTPH
jgi:hypothetical protein